VTRGSPQMGVFTPLKKWERKKGLPHRFLVKVAPPKCLSNDHKRFPVGDQRRSEQNRVHSPDKHGSTIAKEWPDKWHWSHEGVLYVNGSLIPVNVSGVGAV